MIAFSSLLIHLVREFFVTSLVTVLTLITSAFASFSALAVFYAAAHRNISALNPLYNWNLCGDNRDSTQMADDVYVTNVKRYAALRTYSVRCVHSRIL